MERGPESDPPPGRIRKLLLCATAVLGPAWVAGRLLGDGVLWTALLFYIPTPLVAALAVSSAAVSWRERRSLALVALAVAALALVYLGRTEIRWARPVEPADRKGVYTLVQWNVFRNYLPWSWKIERLRAISAHVFVLNELPRQVSRGNWALRLGPGMQYSSLAQTMVACRGEVLEEEVEVEPGLVALWVRCRIDGHELSILAVDMAADPTLARDPVLAHLAARIAERRPDLVAGDFNAPRRSRRLQALPAGYRHAYEVAGGGWPYTWPMPLPMLAIDQCIAGPRLRPLAHRFVTTFASDHRLQILDFLVEGGDTFSAVSRRPPAHRRSEGANYLWHIERGGGILLRAWGRRYWSMLQKLAKNRPSWKLTARPLPAIGPFCHRSVPLQQSPAGHVRAGGAPDLAGGASGGGEQSGSTQAAGERRSLGPGRGVGPPDPAPALRPSGGSRGAAAAEAGGGGSAAGAAITGGDPARTDTPSGG
ncbi:MAG: hypothetical protein MI919_20235 [Holophagales bacterium]|nr:hypothetical protein [Holophagales bacterium]